MKIVIEMVVFDGNDMRIIETKVIMRRKFVCANLYAPVYFKKMVPWLHAWIRDFLPGNLAPNGAFFVLLDGSHKSF